MKTASQIGVAKSTTFKRVAIGSKFSTKGGNFRKSGASGAVKLKANGRGETNANVKFTRSAACVSWE